LSATVTPFAWKNALPRLFVVAGPVKPWRMKAGFAGRVEAADRRDPAARRGAGRALRERLLHVRDRVRVLERRVIAGPVAHQDDVVVVVDDPRDDGPSLEVDHLDLAVLVDVVADTRDDAVPDHELRDHAVLRVHRVDPAVDEGDPLVVRPRLAGRLAALAAAAAAERHAGAAEADRRTRRGRAADELLPREPLTGRLFLLSAHARPSSPSCPAEPGVLETAVNVNYDCTQPLMTLNAR
jgi:hypothetical protein